MKRVKHLFAFFLLSASSWLSDSFSGPSRCGGLSLLTILVPASCPRGQRYGSPHLLADSYMEKPFENTGVHTGAHRHTLYLPWLLPQSIPCAVGLACCSVTLLLYLSRLLLWSPYCVVLFFARFLFLFCSIR